MPDITTSVNYIADLELYKTEKPYVCILSPEYSSENVETSNVEFETRPGIQISDIRNRESDYSLEKSGFVAVKHRSRLTTIADWDEIRGYQRETEDLLTKRLEAERVFCFDVKLRANEPFKPGIKDLRDWTIPDNPAFGAHNDVTLDSGPAQIERHLPADLKDIYLQPGYRFRIFNTWRPLLPVLEDNPLALCDFRSIDKDDLIACDRVIPSRAGEVYYLRYNAGQRWHWLEHMTQDELFLFIMYDSAPGDQARYCPHVPIDNPNAPQTAPKRRSIETRCIVISKC